MLRKILAVFFFLCVAGAQFSNAAEPIFETAQIADQKYYVGEKLTYKINYLGIPVGEAVSEVLEKVEVRGRLVYHIAVKVKSYRGIDLFYKVRDEHHSYVDVETLASLSYSGKIREGRNKFDESSEYDPSGGKMTIRRGDQVTYLSVPDRVQDQLSCGYFFRTLPIKGNSSFFIPVHAEGKNWNMEIKTYGSKTVKIESVGQFQVLETEPLMPFRGIFRRADGKGKIKGLIGLDKRRIPLRMTVKIPVLGHISSELTEYIPGKE